jgi:hypothetical protein
MALCSIVGLLFGHVDGVDEGPSVDDKAGLSNDLMLGLDVGTWDGNLLGILLLAKLGRNEGYVLGSVEGDLLG